MSDQIKEAKRQMEESDAAIVDDAISENSITLGHSPSIINDLISLDDCRTKASLCSYISSSYIGLSRPGTILCNRGEVNQHTPILVNLNIDHFDVKLTEGSGIRWTYDMATIDESDTKSMSVRSMPLSKEVDLLDSTKLRHDLVAMAFTPESTDVKLGSVFKGIQWDPLNVSQLSPDVYVFSDNVHHFIELATTNSRSPHVISNLFQSKIEKYYRPLLQAKMPNISLTVVIVSPELVTSNIPLPDYLSSWCQQLYHLGRLIEYKADLMQIPLKIGAEDDLGYICDAISRSIESVKVVEKGEDPICISKEFIDRVIDPSRKVLVEKVFKYVSYEVNKTIDNHEDITMEQNYEIHKRMVLDYETSQTTSGPFNPSQKPCTNMPLVFINRAQDANDKVLPLFFCPHMLESNPTLTKCWARAFDVYKSSPLSIEEKLGGLIAEAYSDDLVDIDYKETERRKRRNLVHRVNIGGALNEADRLVLMKDGIWAKKYDGTSQKETREKQQKTPISYQADTSDIDDWILNSSCYEKSSISCLPISIDLVESSYEKTGQSKEGLNVVKELMDTKLYTALELISDIAVELSISMRQNTKKDEMILKKLLHFNAYLLIRPTKLTSHIFYSLWIPNQQDLEILQSGPFRTMHKLYDGSYVTDFCSFRSDKLENQATASSILITLYSFWTQFYNNSFARFDKAIKNPDFIKMMNICLLIRLEDKACTEEVITQSRYMYMEALKQKTWELPNPFKVLQKFPKFYRSRLQVWFAHRLINTFLYMSKDPPVRCLDDPEEDLDLADSEEIRCYDHWKGLVNFVTGGPIYSASKLVNLFYLGYLKDKNEIAQDNSDFKLLDKALVEELKYNPINVDKSNGQFDDYQSTPGSKQFSFEMVNLGCKITRDKVKKTYGAGWENHIDKQILLALASHTSDKLATFKASSPITHQAIPLMATIDSDLATKRGRKKCIEAVMDKLDLFSTNPYLSFKQVVDFIESTTKGVVADLFKKNQHAGLREIYVLTVESRIVALFLETIARVLCEEMECETMTHPANRSRLVDAHRIYSHKRVYNKPGRVQEHFYSSMDKSKWNNEFVMSIMAMPLLLMTPQKYHGAIQRCLNMWVNRLIEIPASIQNLLYSNSELVANSYTRLKDEFLHGFAYGPSTRLFLTEKSKFLRFRTGMMQGILHYASSLLHVVFLNFTEFFLRETMRLTFPSHVLDVTQMCSSDDSGLMLTLTHPDPLDDVEGDNAPINNKRASCFSQMLLHTIPGLAKYYCMEDSVKSTIGSRDAYEFNSEFIMTNTMSVATFKFVNVAISCTESQSLDQRMSSLYNLLTSVASANFPSFNTSLVQIAQALFHYKLMGCGVSLLFDHYSLMLASFPCPRYGYFIMDNVLVSGVLGFPYNHWKHCKANPKIMTAPKKSYARNNIRITEDGGVLELFALQHGDNKRQYSMIQHITGSKEITKKDLFDEVESKFELLYRDARVKTETEFKIKAKAVSPGAAISLARGVPFLQALSSSVFGITTHCWTKVVTLPDGTKRQNKVSLLAELQYQSDLHLNQQQEDVYKTGMEAEALMFPNHAMFKEYDVILRDIATWMPVRKKTLRCRKTVIQLPHYQSRPNINLLQLIKYFWWNDCVLKSLSELNQAWEDYSEKFPWLDKDPAKCLEASPFTSHQEMYGFFSSEQQSSRTFTKIGPGARVSNPMGQIIMLAKRGVYLNHVLVPPHHDRVKVLSKMRPLRCSLALSLIIPINVRRHEISMNLLQEHPLSDVHLASMDSRARRDSQLTVMQMVAQGRSTRQVLEAISKLGFGLIFSYIQMQESKEVPSMKGITNRYYGIGTFQLSNKDFVVRLFANDNLVTHFETSSIDKLKEYRNSIEKIIKFLNLDLSKDRRQELAFTENGVYAYQVGTEITLNSDLVIPNAYNVEFGIRTSLNKMDLVQKNIYSSTSDDPLYRREHVIFSHSVRPCDAMSIGNTSTYTGFWEAFVNQGKLDSDSAASTIMASVRNMKTSDQEENLVRDLLARTLRERLSTLWLWSSEENYVVNTLKTVTTVEDIFTNPKYSFKRPSEISMEGTYFHSRDFANVLGESDDNTQVGLGESYGATALELAYNTVFDYQEGNMEVYMDRARHVTGHMTLWEPLINAMRLNNPSYWSLMLGKGLVPTLQDPHLAIFKLLKPDSRCALNPYPSVNPDPLSVASATRNLFDSSRMDLVKSPSVKSWRSGTTVTGMKKASSTGKSSSGSNPDLLLKFADSLRDIPNMSDELEKAIIARLAGIVEESRTPTATQEIKDKTASPQSSICSLEGDWDTTDLEDEMAEQDSGSATISVPDQEVASGKELVSQNQQPVPPCIGTEIHEPDDGTPKELTAQEIQALMLNKNIGEEEMVELAIKLSMLEKPPTAKPDMYLPYSKSIRTSALSRQQQSSIMEFTKYKLASCSKHSVRYNHGGRLPVSWMDRKILDPCSLDIIGGGICMNELEERTTFFCTPNELIDSYNEAGTLYDTDMMDHFMDLFRRYCGREDLWPSSANTQMGMFDRASMSATQPTPMVCLIQETSTYEKDPAKVENIERDKDLKRVALSVEKRCKTMLESAKGPGTKMLTGFRKTTIEKELKEAEEQLLTLNRINVDLPWGKRMMTDAEIGKSSGHFVGFIQDHHDMNTIYKVDGMQSLKMTQSEIKALSLVYGNLDGKQIKVFNFPTQTATDCGPYVLYSLVSLALGWDMYPLVDKDLRGWVSDFYSYEGEMDSPLRYYNNLRPRKDFIHNYSQLPKDVFEITVRLEQNLIDKRREDEERSRRRYKGEELEQFNFYLSETVQNAICPYQDNYRTED